MNVKVTAFTESKKFYYKLGYYIEASRANNTLFSRAFHTTSRYDFRAYDIRPSKNMATRDVAYHGKGNFKYHLKLLIRIQNDLAEMVIV